MKNIEILTSFETEINLLDNELQKPSTDDSLYWLNQATNKFVKTRFNGDQTHHTGYEQTEKRRSDLSKLFRSEDLQLSEKFTSNASYDYYTVTYPKKTDKHPEEFMYALNEDVVITDLDGAHRMNTCVFECTQDSFMYRINNSLTDFHYRWHRARPIRTRTDNGCILYTDKNYNITTYTLGYIKKPDVITLDEPFADYSDFDDSTMYEIIKMAAQMYLENKKDERYQTITAEVITQE